MVLVSISGKATQKGNGLGHGIVVPAGHPVLLRVVEGIPPEHMVPDLKPAGKQAVQFVQQRGGGGMIRVKQPPGQQAEPQRQRCGSQSHAVPDAAFKKGGQGTLQQKQNQQQYHGNACPAAAGHQQRVGCQGSQAAPAPPAQARPTQPAPGKKHTGQPGTVPVVMAIAVIPVAAVVQVGHQRRCGVQQLHRQQPASRCGKVDLQHPAQINILGTNAKQNGKQKPLVVPVCGGKHRKSGQRGSRQRLLFGLPLGQQQAFGNQQHRRRNG